MEREFLTEESLLIKIEELVMVNKCNYIDAVLDFCEKNNLDIDDIRKVIGKSLTERLKVDAISSGFYKHKNKPAKLPI